MKRLLLAAALAVCSVLAGGAQAVTTTGFPDNGLHPEVGAIMVPARSGVGYAEVCSGTLVSPTIFLTASHCTSFLEADPRPDYVTFDETDVEPFPSGLIRATPVTNPAYKGGYRADVSVMVLASEVTNITPAQVCEELRSAAIPIPTMDTRAIRPPREIFGRGMITSVSSRI